MTAPNNTRLTRYITGVRCYDVLLQRPKFVATIMGIAVALIVLGVGFSLIGVHGNGWPWWFHGLTISAGTGLFAGLLARLHLREAKSREYREIFDAANDAIFVHDLRTGKILDINRKGCEMYGYSREGICARTIQELSSGEPPYTQEEAVRYVERAALGRPALFEWHAKTSSGKLFWVEVNLKRACLNARDCVLALVRDISDRKQLEEELVQTRKMQAIGTLAGGIAHDFNNLLGAISGYCELMLMRMDPQDALCADLQKVRTCTATAAELTKQLLAFSRRETIAPVFIDFNEAVAGFTSILPRLLGEQIDVVARVSEAPLFVKASPGQIEQCIMNLAVNARDAMPNGGRLTLQTTTTLLPLASDDPYAHSHAYACLTIQDNGVGMDEMTLAHIFEPFFSTKERGKGTGLGLSVVYGLVVENHGRITIDSKLGQGTTVRIYWPQCESPSATAEVACARRILTRGSETILLVEDFDGLRQATRAFLEMEGYKVLEAPNGAEAIRTVRQYAGKIDLLLTDVIMPGMNGVHLAQRIAILRPGITILFTSGYTAAELDPHEIAESALIEKPFTFDALARKIRDLLDSAENKVHGGVKIVS